MLYVRVITVASFKINRLTIKSVGKIKICTMYFHKRSAVIAFGSVALLLFGLFVSRHEVEDNQPGLHEFLQL